MSTRSVMVGAACAAVLVACASPPKALPPANLGLPTTATVHPLATTTVYTSPDGGIYENPDPLSIIMVARAPGSSLSSLLPGDSAVITQLSPLGDFTFVGLRISNHGQAGSDEQLNVAQIASDFAPPETASGALRQYYHPMFALALLGQQSSDSSCAVRIDPGQSDVVVLVYPPIDATASIVWGVYSVFALRTPLGGALPQGVASWQATPCVPPEAPPS
ncbi:MAG: hypothetical protein JOY68_03315 [Candidatus Dormibacteraeota bacterium]|nr:hypothetical protein [Candidatus Dormibacteraeota bacterium]